METAILVKEFYIYFGIIEMINNDDIKIGVIGLGYVGLPLAIEFGKKYSTLGFDINRTRVDELKVAKDRTLECSEDEIKSSTYALYTNDIKQLEDCNVYVVTVPDRKSVV